MAPVEVESEKRLLPGQPAPFYLTRQGAGGEVGYVVWVVPRWDLPEDSEPPAADPRPDGASPGGNP